jgi:hypothetical protein
MDVVTGMGRRKRQLSFSQLQVLMEGFSKAQLGLRTGKRGQIYDSIGLQN